VQDVKGRSIRNTLEMGRDGGLKKEKVYSKNEEVLKIERTKLEEAEAGRENDVEV